MGGGGGDKETVQKADPWWGQQPYLTRLYQHAGALEEQQPYPGQTHADFSPESLVAQDWQTHRAFRGSPVLEAGQEATRATAAGDYLYGGDAFTRAYQASERTVAPKISGAFSQAGRYGSGLHQESLSRGLGDAFAELYGKERGLQTTAAALSPQMAAADYADIQALGQVGISKEAKQQQEISDLVRKWEFSQQAPYQRVQAQSGIIQGGFPGSQSVMEGSDTGPSPTQGAVGGGVAGAAAGYQYTGNPWGAAIGGVLGAAAGGLSASSK